MRLLRLRQRLVQRSGAIHGLTAGAMATTVLAVITRAMLGHTGREIKADKWTVGIYVLVTLGAGSFGYMRMMEIAGTLWSGAFLLFALTYGPIL